MADKNQKRKIALMVAFRGFRDEEYFVTKEVLESAGFGVENFSSKKGKGIGAEGGEIEIDFLAKDLNLNDFEALVFIGGSGCLKHLDNEISYRAAKETVFQNKVLAAICISPIILAKAGVLKSKKATVWTSQTDKSAVQTLKDNGAIFIDNAVVADGKIITGSGPEAAKGFGVKIIEALTEI